jgi:hypothetical protein
MAVTTARKEHHLAAADAAERERTGRVAIGSARHVAPAEFHIRKLRQPAAANDRQHPPYSFTCIRMPDSHRGSRANVNPRKINRAIAGLLQGA